MTNTKPDGLARSPLHLLHRVSQLATEMFGRELGESDVTPRQVAVLMTVAEYDGLSQSSIVGRTGIDRSTLTNVVRRLQKKRWLKRRRREDDARAYAVKLTNEGRDLLRKASPLVRKVDQKILAALPDQSREGFIERLATIVDKLEAAAKGP